MKMAVFWVVTPRWISALITEAEAPLKRREAFTGLRSAATQKSAITLAAVRTSNLNIIINIVYKSIFICKQFLIP
jgi:hypothetical protein